MNMENELRRLRSEYRKRFDDEAFVHFDSTVEETVELIKMALERGTPLTDDDLPDVPPPGVDYDGDDGDEK